MKLLTLNSHSWLEENQVEKMKHLAEMIAKEDIDVIALQEVNQLDKEEILFGEVKKDNFAYLLCKELEKLGKSYEFTWDHHHVGYDIYNEGTALLFKGEKKEVISEFLGTSKDRNHWKTRKFSMVSLKKDGKLYDFYSCHMGWWNDPENSFEIQLDQLIEFAKKRGNRFFLMGDFNNSAEVKNEGYDYVLEKGIYDTYLLANKKDDGITVPGVIAGWEGKCSKPKRIDFIFTNEKMEVESSEVVFNGQNYDVVSDHFGVMIKIKD